VGLYRREFLLETTSPILIHGAGRKTIGNREYAIPEMRAVSLKGEMRWLLRALLGRKLSSKEVKCYDFLLNGSTEKASLWSVYVELVSGEEKKILIAKHNGKPVYSLGYSEGTVIRVVFVSKNASVDALIRDLFTFWLWYGGIGNRWRHGFGKFKRIDGDEINKNANVDEFVNSVIENFNISPCNLKVGNAKRFPVFHKIFSVSYKEIGKYKLNSIPIIKAAIENLLMEFLEQDEIREKIRDNYKREKSLKRKECERKFSKNDEAKKKCYENIDEIWGDEIDWFLYKAMGGVRLGRVPSRFIYRPLSDKMRIIKLTIPEIPLEVDDEVKEYLPKRLKEKIRDINRRR